MLCSPIKELLNLDVQDCDKTDWHGLRRQSSWFHAKHSGGGSVSVWAGSFEKDVSDWGDNERGIICSAIQLFSNC